MGNPKKHEVNTQNDMTAQTVLQYNPDFAAFVDRMRALNRSFLVKKKGSSDVELVESPEQPENGDDVDKKPDFFERETKWLDCCLRDFLEKRSSYGSISMLLVRITAVLIIVAAALYYLWPLWELFVDVEADAYYGLLGISTGAQPQEIKRAYREAVKRWHPDRNPNCDYCRIQMIKVQQAHDVLLSRGSQRFELADRYREGLAQLRSLVFFRMHHIAFYAAQGIYCLAQSFLAHRTTDNGDASRSLQVLFRVLTMSFFTLFEMIYVSGFSIVIMIQVFYYCVSAAKVSAREQEVMETVKRSYFDLYKETMMFTLLPFVLHLIQFSGNKEVNVAGDVAHFFFHSLLGILYILSHLYCMTPSLLDNITMKKCTVPLTYSGSPAGNVSFWSFIFTELGLILDDILAFTSRVPSVYRLTIIFVHVIFLCEFIWLPREPMISGKGRLREKRSLKHQTEKGKTERKSASEDRKNPQCTLSPVETDLVNNLDAEVVSWLDVVSIKYKKQIDNAVEKYSRSRQEITSFTLLPTSNLREVVFVGTVHEKSGAVKRSDVLFRIRDDVSSRLLGLQRGPLGCIASETSESGNPSAIASRYAQAAGKEGRYTPSDLWRSKLTASKLCCNDDGDSNNNRDIVVIVVAGIGIISFLVLTFFCAPMASNQMKYMIDLPAFQQPLRSVRLNFLPDGHILRRKGAALVTFSGHVFCTVDVWDAIRHIQQQG